MESLLPSTFEYGIAAGVITILAYIVFFIIKKQNDREEKMIKRSAEREDKLMGFVLGIQPTQESILQLVKEMNTRLEIVESNMSPRKKW